ncbi:MAG: VWA domain-containing protein [Candidatus Thorarchaeota archaeon]
MKVDTRYILLGAVGIILIVSAFVLSPPFVNDDQTLDGEPATEIKLGSMIPDDVTIEGSIVDSYVDVLYVMKFDNNDATTASEINWLFELQDGIRLSNVSVVIGEITYWGQVMPEQAAIEAYNASVEENESALLVVKAGSGYRVRFNLENGTEAIVGVKVEGLLVRRLGLYSLELPIARGVPITANVILDLKIRSNFEPIAGYSIKGLPSFTASDLTNGIHIVYTSVNMISIENLEIRYTLDRQLGGSQLLTYTNGTDNFFVYLLAPSITEVSDGAHRQYVFILDKSGSMGGTKIEQARTAFNSMIETLLPSDLFNVVAFDHEVSSLWVEPHSASATSIDEAQAWVRGIQPGGSTNFHGAMMEGLGMMGEGEYVKAILMLSDGLPTAGSITDTPGILTAVEEANDIGVSISTVAFGSDSDENLMANLAAQQEGFFVFIQPTSDAAAELVEFYYEFATPLAESYSIEFDGVSDMSTLMPLNESPFFNGSEVIVCGRYGASMSVDTVIDYPDGTEIYTNSATSPSTENEHIEKLWAQHRITSLLRTVQFEGETPSLRAEIVCLGMGYGIIVEGYTALLITTEDIEDTTTTDETTSTTTTTTTTGTYTTTTTTAPPTASTTATSTTATTSTTGADSTGMPPATFDSSLSIVTFAVGMFIMVVFGSIVLRRRRT